jgi:hypothetical protein
MTIYQELLSLFGALEVNFSTWLVVSIQLALPQCQQLTDMQGRKM